MKKRPFVIYANIVFSGYVIVIMIVNIIRRHTNNVWDGFAGIRREYDYIMTPLILLYTAGVITGLIRLR